jgi:hypothetical protein
LGSNYQLFLFEQELHLLFKGLLLLFEILPVLQHADILKPSSLCHFSFPSSLLPRGAILLRERWQLRYSKHI